MQIFPYLHCSAVSFAKHKLIFGPSAYSGHLKTRHEASGLSLPEICSCTCSIILYEGLRKIKFYEYGIYGDPFPSHGESGQGACGLYVRGK